MGLDGGHIINNTVITTHNAGFFSNCNVKLTHITMFIFLNKRLPDIVDSSRQFEWYKNGTTDDITYDYFEHYDNITDVSIDCKNPVYYDWERQFYDYRTLHYDKLIPIVKKYFTPSIKINTIVKQFEEKYNLNYDNMSVLFYRGNDKNPETKICEYSEYIPKANEILKEHPTMQFLIQSDETGFIEAMTAAFPHNSFVFKDETRHVNKCNSTVDILMKENNHIFSKYYLAITIIMSKCKYIVCGSGNCSLFIILYRGHTNNVYQNLNGKWIVSKT